MHVKKNSMHDKVNELKQNVFRRLCQFKSHIVTRTKHYTKIRSQMSVKRFFKNFCSAEPFTRQKKRTVTHYLVKEASSTRERL